MAHYWRQFRNDGTLPGGGRRDLQTSFDPQQAPSFIVNKRRAGKTLTLLYYTVRTDNLETGLSALAHDWTYLRRKGACYTVNAIKLHTELFKSPCC